MIAWSWEWDTIDENEVRGNIRDVYIFTALVVAQIGYVNVSICQNSSNWAFKLDTF